MKASGDHLTCLGTSGETRKHIWTFCILQCMATKYQLKPWQQANFFSQQEGKKRSKRRTVSQIHLGMLTLMEKNNLLFAEVDFLSVKSFCRLEFALDVSIQE